VRFDSWNFGILCVEGPCPSGVNTISVGAKYRLVGATSVVPYAGGDIGYMEWTSDATGASLRLRAGADISVIRHVDFNVDVGFTRFVERSKSEGRMLENHLWGFSAGLRLRL
jgi:hypothetical protein